MTRRPVRAMIVVSSLLFLSGSSWLVDAQQPRPSDAAPPSSESKPIDVSRFEDQIRAFERADEKNPPPKGAVLFTGSSSVKLWHKELQKDFEGLKVLGRGFGGSTMPELLHFMDRIVIKYEPRAVVVYEGDNDLSIGRNVEQLMSDYRKFARKMKKQLPDCRVYVLAIKPSPSRQKLWDSAKEANDRLKSWCDGRKNWIFVDVASPMLDENGAPKADLFLKDKLHMNRAGYDLWKETLKPFLIKSKSDSDLVTR